MYLKQQYNGIVVENGDANVHVDRLGRVFSFASSFYMGAGPQEEKSTVIQQDNGQMVFARDASSPVVTPTEAVVRFAEFIKMPEVPSVELLSESFVFDSAQDVFPGSNLQDEPVLLVSGVPFASKHQVAVTRKYLIVTEPEARLVPVWDLLVDMQDGENWFHAQMEMMTGQVHQLIDWVHEASYSVYPIGVNDPSDGPRSLVENPEDALASPLGWHDQGSAGRGRRSGDGKFTNTVGNNVWAQVQFENVIEEYVHPLSYGLRAIPMDVLAMRTITVRSERVPKRI